jgi:type IV pilus assembly protein PilV
MSAPRPVLDSRQRGMTLLEVLISMVICAFGLLGFVALQARAAGTEFESFQRSQALVLVQDMVNRLNANRGNAASYVTAGLIGDGAIQDCSGKTGADYDLCDWANMIRGSTETRGGASMGAMMSARGQISRVSTLAGQTTTHAFTVCVVWRGMVASGAPMSTCGSTDGNFPSNLRRVVESTVCMAQLTDTAASAPRC